MKKHIFSLLLALLLILTAAPAAYAATEIDLGSVTAGSDVKVYISEMPFGVVESVSLPSGCYIESENGSLYLRGTPYFAGHYRFDLSSGDDYSVTCSVNILPAVPSVDSCRDVTCQVGDSVELYVDTYIGDGGSISYQWYQSSSRSSSGGSAISGATGSWYAPSTASSGTFYYYCQVTNTNSGYTASSYSSPITVTVGRAGPSSISISSMPKKTEYTVGDMLDPDGLTVLVVYPDRQETIKSDFDLSPMQLNSAGIQSIRVSYEGCTCSFPVNVKEKAERKLEIVSRPTKQSYKVGDRLDTSGLKLRLTDGSRVTEISSGFSCTPSLLDTAGSQVITVKYEDLSCTFSVRVEEGRREISLSVKSLPSRTTYTVGESLDTTGLTFTLTTSEGTETISSGVTFNPSVFNSKGRQLVEARYHDLTCTFVVSVSDKAATPSPSPSPSPSAQPTDAPSTPTPSPAATPRPSHESDGSKGSSGAVIVLVIALIALIGLSAYVLIMNNGGVHGLIENIKRSMKRR